MPKLIQRIRSDAWDEGNYLTRFYECEWECDCEDGWLSCPECDGVGCEECGNHGVIPCPECDGEGRYYTYE